MTNRLSCAGTPEARRQIFTGPAGLGLLAGAALIVVTTTPAHAIILLSTGDITANTTAPGGLLAGSGWQYEGTWGGVLGTAIAPNYFVTATHVGGSVGGTFNYNGNNYTTTAKFSSPSSDLTIWQVSGTFTSYAPLYTGTDEVGHDLVDIGRGTRRGADVTIASGPDAGLKGWQWGTADGVQRWGQNTVSGIANGGGSLGQLLVADFNSLASGGLTYEATLSSGDSGGGLFIQSGGVWKLAGINYAVDNPFRTSAGGTDFNAAIFDARGLYFNSGSGFQQVGHPVPDGEVSASFYATRISSNLGWIESVTAVPEPQMCATGAGLALLAFAVARRRC